MSQFLADFDGGLGVDVSHASLGEVEFLKDVLVGDLGQDVDQGAPDAEDFLVRHSCFVFRAAKVVKNQIPCGNGVKCVIIQRRH